jgi:hypothetical protein
VVEGPIEDGAALAALGMVEGLLSRRVRERVGEDRRLRENLLGRRLMLRVTMGSAMARAEVRERCKGDLCWYIEQFVWQFNPRKEEAERVGPFIPWEFQVRALREIERCYREGETCVVEKSRDMGATWLFLIFQDWLCLFQRHTQTLNFSRNQEAVDDPSPDSLFWKLRFMHQYLPRWLAGEIETKNRFFKYEQTGSYVTGEATTKDVGVGGRAALIFGDELPKIRDAQAIVRFTASVAECRFFNGTHTGTDTAFYRLTQSEDVSRITMHWTEHPEKRPGLYRAGAGGRPEILDTRYQFPPGYRFVLDGTPTGGPYPGLRSPWYDKKAKAIGDSRGVAMDLDIDPRGSASQYFDVLILRRVIERDCLPPVWEGELEYEAAIGRPIGLKRSKDGRLKLWVAPKDEAAMPFGRYAVAADVSAGTGATPTCISAGNAETMQKILEFSDPFMSPGQVAELMVALAYLLVDQENKPALVGWEIPGPGLSCGVRMLELGFTNVYRKSLETAGVQRSVQETAGWTASVQGKRGLLQDYKDCLREGLMVNPSAEAVWECRNFRYNSQGAAEHMEEKNRLDPSAARLNHGDKVIADALLYKLLKLLGGTAQREERAEHRFGSLAWRRELRQAEARNADQWSGWK